MKSYIRILVDVTTVDGHDMYEIDSYWSQEAQAFCEKVLKEVKELVSELTGRAEKVITIEEVEGCQGSR